LLSTAGYDYSLSGTQWSNPAHITYSVAPDGVFWDHGVNDLNAVFNSAFGDGAWQRQIGLALATWESVANINFAQVPDGPFNLNALGLSQGDSRFGDIRFGGYSFPDDRVTLAQAYEPPPSGVTEAGDVEINTAMNWHIGQNYDLFSVMLHETGHSLGLGHAQNPADVMDETYQGVRTGLGPGDIAGIQALYGPRKPDHFQAGGQGTSFVTAVDISSGLAASASTTVGGLSLDAIGDTEYFHVTAPSWSGSVLQVEASAADISLLSPQVRVYDGANQLLGANSDPGAWGNAVTLTLQGITPGQTYTIAVTGATGSAFDVGAYQLTATFPEGSVPVRPTPPPFVPSGNPAASAPPASTNTTMASASWLGPIGPGTIVATSFARTDGTAWFEFRALRAGWYRVSAAGTAINVLNVRTHRVMRGVGSVDFRVARKGQVVYVKVWTHLNPQSTLW
jgi:hypothetical protein